MDRITALSRMVPPSKPRLGKYRQGIIQIWLTRACDKSCFGCTQASNLGGHPGMITLEQFEQAVVSLKDYFGVVGIFGGNPAVHPKFEQICKILRRHIAYERRGLWCNNPMGKGKIMQETFDPAISNLNVHLDGAAYREFRRDWPEAKPFGLDQDSRHSPPYIAMQDLVEDEGKRWELISDCDINQHWSAMICVFRKELRGFFCEVAGAQAMLHQHEPDYPDTGLPVELGWWRRSMQDFGKQVDLHCHACGVPLRALGELAVTGDGTEKVTKTHANVYKLKTANRPLQLVTSIDQVEHKVKLFTDYIRNAN